MKAKEIMTRDVICISPDASIREAYDLMRTASIRHLPVVAGTALLGVVSDRDILPFTRDGAVVADRAIEEVMTEAPIVVSPKTTIARIAEHMLEYKIDCVPVVVGDRLIGMVTSTDMLVLLLAPLEPATTGLPFEFNLLTPGELRSLRAVSGASA